MKFDYCSRSDIGKKRKQNQDSCSAHPDQGLFVVADGMGGHLGGGTASAMVVGRVPEEVTKAQQQKSWDPKAVITDALVLANREIYERSSKESNLHGMGTTATSLLFTKKALTIGHVGDSRCYFFRPNECWQLTRDHSLVEEKRRAGLITRAEIKTDSMKNVITRSVGFEPQVEVDIYEMEVQKGDLFLVCSDGLTGMVDEKVMTEIVTRGVFKEDSIEKTVNELIDTANRNGGEDNVTVILIQVLAP